MPWTVEPSGQSGQSRIRSFGAVPSAAAAWLSHAVHVSVHVPLRLAAHIVAERRLPGPTVPSLNRRGRRSATCSSPPDR